MLNQLKMQKKGLVEEKKKIRDKELNAVVLEVEEEKKYWEDNKKNTGRNNNFQHKKKKFRRY